jgi:hypothetical protein
LAGDRAAALLTEQRVGTQGTRGTHPLRPRATTSSSARAASPPASPSPALAIVSPVSRAASLASPRVPPWDAPAATWPAVEAASRGCRSVPSVPTDLRVDDRIVDPDDPAAVRTRFLDHLATARTRIPGSGDCARTDATACPPGPATKSTGRTCRSAGLAEPELPMALDERCWTRDIRTL